MENNSTAGLVCTAGSWLTHARQLLEDSNSLETRALDAQVLLAHVLQKPRAWLIAHPEFCLTPQQKSQLDHLLERLAAGQPLPYLIGHWEFYGLDFVVTPDVLIPRPETELLVEKALAWLRQNPTRQRAADVGTGSGCIAVSLAKHTPSLQILAVDRSRAALQVARLNAIRNQAGGQVLFLQGSLLSGVSAAFDLVCANLPYIPRGVLHDLPVAKHEPRLALDGGEDGTEAILSLLEDAPRWLAPGGLLLLEMQFDQGEIAAGLAQARLPRARITIHPDLAGLPRLVEVLNTPGG